MASTKVIATTWSKKDLVAKLKATLKRMDSEITEWEKEDATYDKRVEAWEKKAVAWAKKNITKATKVNAGNHYRNNNSWVTFEFTADVFNKEVGEQPERSCKPTYKNTSYNQSISYYEEVENAIALVEGSTDTEFKISTSSNWARFIK